MIFIFVILGELLVRVYYWHIGEHIAMDDNELCFKKMKIDNLPTDTKRGYFVNFKRTGIWEDDPVIGATLKKNYTEDKIYPIVINGEAKTLVIYGEHHYNSQGMSSRDDFSLKKPDNVNVRIALFGDSFTCGDQAPLLFNMGSVLKELIPKSEVLNFCVPAKGIDSMYARYVVDAKKYKPSVVFFNVFIDDILRPSGGCQIETPNVTVNNGRIVIGPRKYPTLRDFYEKYQLPKFESYFIKHILWVYDQHTKSYRDMERGYGLFNVMVDDLKEQTKEQNSTLIISLIQSGTVRNKNTLQMAYREYYDKLVQLLKAKNVTYFDSEKYFETKRIAYRNQSFYYLQGLYKQDETLGHFSPIGSALFAQGMKNILEDMGRVNRTINYNFANFDENIQLLYLIPEGVNIQLQGNIRTISPFEFRDANYTDNRRLDYLQEK